MTPNDEQKTPRPFEPPPWEKELYDELAQKEGEEPAGERGLDTVRESLGDREAVAEATEEPVTPAEPERTTDEGALAAKTEGPPAASGDIGDVAEKMLFELAAQESAEGPTHVWAWSLGVGLLVGLIGLSMATYSVVALSRTYGAGVTALAGSSIMGLFGLVMLGMGAWVAVRSWSKRGEI
jgi:uncharacterized membrane protein